MYITIPLLLSGKVGCGGISDKYVGWKGLSNEPQEFTGYKPACRCLMKYLMK